MIPLFVLKRMLHKRMLHTRVCRATRRSSNYIIYLTQAADGKARRGHNRVVNALDPKSRGLGFDSHSVGHV